MCTTFSIWTTLRTAKRSEVARKQWLLSHRAFHHDEGAPRPHLAQRPEPGAFAYELSLELDVVPRVARDAVCGHQTRTCLRLGGHRRKNLQHAGAPRRGQTLPRKVVCAAMDWPQMSLRDRRGTGTHNRARPPEDCSSTPRGRRVSRDVHM
jgi:hypothetical protein